MPTPNVPPAATLLSEAAQIINLGNETYRYGVLAGAIAAANAGTPLPPSSTTQQFLNYIGGILQSQIPSNLLSVVIRQFLTFIYRNSVLVGSVALSGSIPSGDGSYATITVDGAEPGDFVEVSTSESLGASYYTFTTQVTSANTVLVGIWNPPGFFTMTLTGKTMYVRVTKRTA